MDSPRRLVNIRKAEMSVCPSPVLTEAEEANRPEFEFSKFVSENTNLSIVKDSMECDSSPTSETEFENLPKMSFYCGEDCPMQMTVGELFQRIFPDLDLSADLDLSDASTAMKSESPERKLSKTATKSPDYSKAINPLMARVVAIQNAWRENILPKYQLYEDEKSPEKKKRKYNLNCSCDIPQHPKHWTFNVIQDVHDHSFLLDYRDLEVDEQFVIGTNYKRTIVFFNVPMVDGHPWKIKAEQVMRFTDVEIGRGDQTAYDLFYYKQPCDRKIFLILTSSKVVGLVVAEKLLSAYYLLKETMRYRDLEDNPVPVRVGINRLWVHVSMRRHHLATLLCDYVGQHFYKGETLKKEDYAFNTEFSGGAAAFGSVYVTPLTVRMYKGKTGIKV